MFRNKTILLTCSLLGCFSVAAVLGALLNHKSAYLINADDNEPSYTIRLSLENNFLDDGIAYTTDGNPIQFTFENITYNENGFTFSQGFKFGNLTPLGGIKSVYFDRKIKWRTKIHRGWDCPEQFPSLPVRSDLDVYFIGQMINDNPSFIMIEDTYDSNFTVSYIDITYSCTHYDAPSEYTENMVFSYKKATDTYQFVGLLDRTKSIVDIPRYYKGKRVSSVAEGALSGCSYLSELYLPFVGDTDTSPTYPAGYIFGRDSYSNSVSIVQEYFPENAYVTSEVAYQFPAGLSTITVKGGEFAYKAFGNYGKLFRLVLFDSCRFNFFSGEGLCSGCENLNEVTLPSYTTVIPTSCFASCPSLTFSIPDSVTSIGNSAFYGCTKIASSITLSRNVTNIGSSAFANCTSIQSIKIPTNVTSVGSRAFLGCSSIYIYCEAESQPEGWNANWNPNSRPVYWGISM